MTQPPRRPGLCFGLSLLLGACGGRPPDCDFSGIEATLERANEHLLEQQEVILAHLASEGRFEPTPRTEPLTFPVGIGIRIGRPGQILYEQYWSGKVRDLSEIAPAMDPNEVSFGGPVGPRSRTILVPAEWLAATAILRLVDAGWLDLDRPLGEYSIPLPDIYERLTLRHLLTHTVGFQLGLCNGSVDDLEECVYARPELAEPPPADEAGTGGTPLPAGPFNHRSGSYMLAGYVAEAVLGMPWRSVFREWLTEPLGMRDTAYPTDSYMAPSVGRTVISTIDDITRFLEAVTRRDPEVLSEALWEEQATPLQPDPYVSGYGIGVWLRHGGSPSRMIGLTTREAPRHPRDTAKAWVDLRSRTYGMIFQLFEHPDLFDNRLLRDAMTAAFFLTEQLTECREPK